jgi:hypothetical protein
VTTRPTTNAERLVAIETILERLEPKVDTLVDEFSVDKADLAALKNRGIGVLVAFGILAGFVGAKLQSIGHLIGSAFR